MHTLTFFSYKGGVGRTLLAANMAKYMARIGMNVILADMDFEAPGLHYKLGPEPGRALPVERGLIDLIEQFVSTEEAPKNLSEYLLPIEPEPHATGTIHFLPAGNAPQAAYFRKLAQMDWKNFLYSEHGHGISFFIELKKLIQESYKPDIMLIDARTGMTDMGGVAAAVLADQAVCLLIPTPEHMEGTRQIMHGIRAAQRMEGAPPVALLAVLSRLPRQEGNKEYSEAECIKTVKDFLNEAQGDAAATLGLEDIPVLHREPLLEQKEQVLVGSGIHLNQSMLLQDYIRLIVKVLPRGHVELSLTRLISDINSMLMAEPDQAEEAMEALAHNCLHPQAYLELLRMYRLRRAPFQKRLEAVVAYCTISSDLSNKLLWECIKDIDIETGLKATASNNSQSSLSALEALWRIHGVGDSGATYRIVDLCESQGQISRAIQILRASIEANPPSETSVARLLDLLSLAEDDSGADELIKHWTPIFGKQPLFLEAWVTAMMRAGYDDELQSFLKDPNSNWRAIERTNHALMARLEYFLTEDKAVAKAKLIITKAVSLKVLAHLGALAREIGEADAFDAKVRRQLPSRFEAYLHALEKIPRLPEVVSF